MMSKLQRKLRSRTGASMLLALVFLLFCMFIGSTVLVSATANAYRVEHLNDQQDFLSQRSVAMLIADELEGEASGKLLLNITDVNLTAKKVVSLNGGGLEYVTDENGNIVQETVRTVTFKAPSGLTMTPFQRLAYESAVWQYLEINKLAPAESLTTGYTLVVVELENFPVTDMDDFWVQYTPGSNTGVGGQVSISGAMEGGTALDIADVDINFECCDKEQKFDFVVSFGDYSQLTVDMDASYGMRNPVELTRITTYKSFAAAEVTTYTSQPIISWDLPEIAKGGV